MARRRMIAANWKMNKTISDAVDFIVNLKVLVKMIEDVDIVVSPPFTAIGGIFSECEKTNIMICAQNLHFEDKGAFTGEISGRMLKEAGADYVIIGHSERRIIFGENNEVINKKVKAAFNSSLIPILCIGETLDKRESGKTLEVIEEQLTACLKGVSRKKAEELIIAYEPVWAISTFGTGVVATPEQAEAVHLFIRETLGKVFDKTAAARIRILYGGSVNPFNAKEFLDQKNIDGALVGGASLEPKSFADIIEIASL